LLRNEKLVTLAKLEKEKEELIKELKKNSCRTVYNEFEVIYKKVYEAAAYEGKLFELEKSSAVIVATIEIYNLLVEFVEIRNKSEEDVIKIYDQIPLFSFDDRIVLREKFEQEEFDLYYRQGFSTNYSDDNPIFLACENYYKLKRLENSINNYELKWSNLKWQKYSDELVMINNKELYLELNELVDNGLNLT